MANNWTDEAFVISQVDAAWPEEPMPALRAYSFAVDRQARRIWLKAHLDHPLSNDAQADIWEIEGAVGVQFPDDWQANTEFEVLTDAQEPMPLGGGFIFRRGDAETPHQRWKRSILQHSRF